jgi:hypothetical protein
MKRILMCALLAAFAACDEGPRYCRKCQVGVVQEHPDARPRKTARCVLNGREIDCTKVPGECPDCHE